MIIMTYGLIFSVSQIHRNIGRKLRIFLNPDFFRLRVTLSESRSGLIYEKARMMGRVVSVVSNV